MQRSDQGTLLKFEALWRARRECEEWWRVRVIENADRTLCFGAQPFTFQERVRAGEEFVLQRCVIRLETRAGNGPDDRFGNQAAVGLEKAGHLCRLEPHAAVVEHAPERARVS